MQNSKEKVILIKQKLLVYDMHKFKRRFLTQYWPYPKNDLIGPRNAQNHTKESKSQETTYLANWNLSVYMDEPQKHFSGHTTSPNSLIGSKIAENDTLNTIK